MDILNNREISIVVWFSIVLTVMLFNKGMRSALKSVLDAIFCRQILISIVIVATYVIIITYLLSQIDLWRTDQIKNTVVWFFSVALVSMLGINKINDNPHYFKKTLKNNLKIIVVIQFIVSVYTFSLFTEILFVPFMVFLGLMIGVSSFSEEHKTVKILLNKLLEYIGIGIILFTIYKLITDFSTIYQEKTVYDFIVPTILSILFLPFLFLLSVYMNYENVFIRLSTFVGDKELLKYAKYKSFSSFLLNTSALRCWAKLVARNKLQNKEEVDNSISNIFSSIKREKNPITVDRKEGWSPYEAMKYLSQEGVKTGHYQELTDQEWFASSPTKELGGGLFPNNVAYFIDGNIDVVNVLKVKLNINDLDFETDDFSYFVLLIEVLCSNALDTGLSYTLKEALISKVASFEEILSTKLCRIEKEKNINNDGYSVKFTIKNK